MKKQKLNFENEFGIIKLYCSKAVFLNHFYAKENRYFEGGTPVITKFIWESKNIG